MTDDKTICELWPNCEPIVHQRYENAARTLCGLEDTPALVLGVGQRVTCSTCLEVRGRMVNEVAAADAPRVIRERLNAGAARRRVERKRFVPAPPAACTDEGCRLQHCDCGTHDFEQVRHRCRAGRR